MQRTKEIIETIETKDKFFNILAHELRNPFNIILGYVGLLQENIRTYDINKVEKFLTIIYNSTTITFDLLTNLLDWLNMQSNKMPFNPDNSYIYELILEEIINTSIIADKKQIIVNNIVPVDLCAYLDKNMVKTIFRNLITNAIKFSDRGSEVLISASEAERFVEITVKDKGAGMSLEVIENVFKIENVNSSKGTEGEPGTGFGLLLCKEFVEIEGGKIWIESKLGQGCEFKFTLPKFNLTNG